MPVVDVDGGGHAILYHLQPRHFDGLLDFGNLHHRFHCLLVRIFSRRPNVSHRLMPAGIPGSYEMAAVSINELFCPVAIFLERLQGVALGEALLIQAGWPAGHLGRRAGHVETRAGFIPQAVGG